MSGGFELQPQDGSPRVALAPGETVIGRGPLLGITDKRVSRRHAILEVVGGQLRIKPIHTNPCFYQSSEKSQLLPLKTNLWHWLNPGDSFSLLVDKYSFRVFSTQSETDLECTLRNSQMLDEDDILNETAKPLLINLPDETTCAPQLERDTEISKTQTTTTNSMCFLDDCRDFSKQQPNFAQRKRILPAWMITEDLSDQNLSIPLISGDNEVIQGDGKEGICKDKTQEVPQSFSAITLSNTEVNTTNTQRKELGKVSEHRIVSKGTPNKKDKALSCSESCSSAQGESLYNESRSSHPESNCDLSSHETLHAKLTVSVPQDSEENKVKRTSCMYGANCYRKNPVHFQHFSHPGDSDYGSLQDMPQDEAHDQPECPYGASCYRKNPQHKIEYRHSTLLVGNILDDSDNVGQPSEHDLDDSFLDDKEEEEYEPTDEDSDWEPEKEDQEKEDVEELLKEAKKFMKRKK
ncbi:aprataxin and PNK-like factor isoform X3 [Choloepus didactylus]|uniref:aprataxin and PNK-like factor isoform X3 n=1 Tax=Choloepus didactylus TaxID=27675 RepID=UPI00189EB673|nr:aprataxin and PNK-like factor isoform X3 [Choloepus didactylus]